MYRIVVGSVTLDGEDVSTVMKKRFKDSDEAWHYIEMADEDGLERLVCENNGISLDDLQEGECWFRIEDTSLKATYTPLKHLANEVEEIRLELFNNETHQENMKEYLNGENIFNEVDKELFAIQSKLESLYYMMMMGEE